VTSECVHHLWVGFERKPTFGHVYEVEAVVFARPRLIVRRDESRTRECAGSRVRFFSVHLFSIKCQNRVRSKVDPPKRKVVENVV
jgi:hypothetical protein